MKLFDLETPQTKKSQKVLEGYFGNSVDFTKLAPRATSNMLTKVRGLIYEHRTTTKMHNSEKDAGYMKLLVMERGLSARLREADIKLEPASGAMHIKSGDKTIGTATTPAAANDFKSAVDKGEIKPVMDSTYRIEEVVDAHIRLETSQHIGKITLQVL